MAALNRWTAQWQHNRSTAGSVAPWAVVLRLFFGGMISVLLLLPQVGHSLAAADPCANRAGNDPTRPFTPIDAWIALQDGDQHWYAFRDEGDSTPIMVRMSVLPVNGATFTILTPAQLSARQQGEAVEAVGAGAASPVLHDDLYWTGSFVQSGIYYVLVESSGRGLSNYMLAIQGSGVSFPLLSFAKAYPPVADKIAKCPSSPTPTPTSQFVPSGTPSVEPTRVMTAVLSSPEEPLPPIGRVLSIQRDELHWYAFRDEGDDGTIAIRATANPDRCMTFALWTPDQLALWRQNEEFRPVGQGTVNDQLNGDLFWTGSFVKSGIYYVVAARDPVVDAPCTYQLRVTGEDVSLIVPPRNQ
jgi:hypothetical protein